MSGRKNSRAKGHTFERSVCRDLRGWLGREWLVQRNLDDDQTGARGRAGDVLVSGGPHRWPFCIECKSGYRVRSSHLWKGSKTIESMWRQTTAQADAVSLEPLLVLKPEETGHPVLVVMSVRARSRLRLGGPCMYTIVNDRSVAVCLWARLLELEPVALLEMVLPDAGADELLSGVTSYYMAGG
jgi:hypothetical protein